jgi:hypothetical protein
MGKIRAPRGLGSAGGALWRSVVGAYDLRPDELLILESAARVTDVIARLDVELDGAPLTVLGSVGQTREHPLMSEQRQQRGLLARLLGQLRLPDTQQGEASQRSEAGRRLARQRWG